MTLQPRAQGPVRDLPGEAEPYYLAEVCQERIFVDEPALVDHDRGAAACAELDLKVV